MPNNDKTGPTRKGPMTGRGMGNCAEDAQNNARGRGMGFGRRGGCCGRDLGRNALSLEEREKILEEQLAEVRKLKTQS